MSALTVVVMGYRNRATILRAVRSVLDQEAPDPFEVIVVTSGDDDSAAAVRARFPGVTLLESSWRLLPGGARNVGVAAAKGNVIAFLAADCLAEPGWVASRLTAHRAGHLAVASSVTNGGARTPSSWASYCLQFAGRSPSRPAGPASYPDPGVYGISFDRALLARLGPFDESMPAGEDVLRARSLAKEGIPVWYEPAVHTAHIQSAGFRHMLADLSRRGRLRARVRSSWEGTPSRGRALWRAIGRWRRLVLSTAVMMWRYAPGDRARLLLFPWLATGAVAFVAGWTKEVLCMAGTASAEPQAVGTTDDPVRSGRAISWGGRS